MLRKSSFSAICLLFVISHVWCQRFEQGSLDFVKHLEKIEAYNECALFLKRYEELYGASDTTYLYQGRMAYFSNNYRASVSYLSQMSDENSSYWDQAQFFLGWQSARLGDLDVAKKSFLNVHSTDPDIEKLKTVELAGIALLEQDLEAYQMLSDDLSETGFDYKKNIEAFDFVYNRIKDKKRKSPFLAGLFSAVVPGAGKFYQGKVGQGTMALAVSAIMGSQAYEGYRKDGTNSARFIIFGSLFSVFYVANIWGSVVAVRVENLHFIEENHETVLLHMHIPIRLHFR